MTISVNYNQSDDKASIIIGGDFNFDQSAEFRKVLHELSNKSVEIVIDMAMVTNVDSSALGMLLLLREKCGSNAAPIKIIKTTPEIFDVMKMANFHTLFELE